MPKEILRLPKKIRSRVKAFISGLAGDPVPLGAAQLRGRVNAYRFRLSDYRVVYEVHVTEVIVFVVGVAHRREVYRRILRRN